jgi:hypothetical protein
VRRATKLNSGEAMNALNKFLLISLFVLPAVHALGQDGELRGGVDGRLLVCKSDTDLLRLFKFIQDQDKEAVEKYIAAKTGSKECVWLTKGTKVFIEEIDVGGSGRLTKFRPQGSPESYFTTAPGVQKLP